MLGGIAFFAVLALVLWGIASLVSHNGSKRDGQPGQQRVSTRFGRTLRGDRRNKTAPCCSPTCWAPTATSRSCSTTKASIPTNGWRIYLGHPADRPITCKVTQVQHTDQFTDCEGRTIAVDRLALPPKGIAPVVSADGILTLDLTPD